VLASVTTFVIWLDVKAKSGRNIIKYVLTYWFGIVSVSSLIVGVLIMKKLQKQRFSESIELLNRFINVLEDAMINARPGSKQRVSILHFAPCPGLFDFIFNDIKRIEKMEELLGTAIKRKELINLRICMLNETSRLRFLEYFYKEEGKKVRQKKLDDKGGFNIYKAQAEAFIERFIEIANPVAEIHESWLAKSIERGEEIIVLGAANSVGFIGSVYFLNGAFVFEAADYAGNANVLHQLYDKLSSIYSVPST
jgi:hypothetical protein